MAREIFSFQSVNLTAPIMLTWKQIHFYDNQKGDRKIWGS